MLPPRARADDPADPARPASPASLAGLASLASVTVHADPFRWLHTPRFLEPHLAAELAADIPDSGFKLAAYGRGQGRFWYQPVSPGNMATLPAPWRGVIAMLTSARYAALLGDLIGTDLRRLHAQATVCRYSADCWLAPHTDRPHRIATQVIYLNPGWQPDWGGQLRILNSDQMDDVSARLSPAFNSSVVFRRSDRSWHAVEPVRGAPSERLSLLAHWSA
jgi:SM-20-related protein